MCANQVQLVSVLSFKRETRGGVFGDRFPPRRSLPAMENVTRNLSETYARVVLPNTVLLALGMGAGAFGNLAVITLYVSRIKDKKGDRYFIPVLASVDCLGCLASGIFYTTDNAFLFVYPSDALCRLLIFLLTFASGFSAHTLLAIALQRYLLICRPFGKQLTLFWRRLSLGVITAVSLGYALPLLGIGGIRHSNSTYLQQTFPSHVCVLSVESSVGTLLYFGLMALLTVANILVTAGLYIPITRAIYRTFSFQKRTNCHKNQEWRSSESRSTQISHVEVQETRVGGQTRPPAVSPKTETRTITQKTESAEQHQEHTHASKRDRVKAKINLMFFIIILVYIVSYLPTLGILIATYALSDFTWLDLSAEGINIWLFCARFLLLNHVINPVIYGYFDLKFRTEFVKLCCGICRRRKEYSVNSQTT